jgi:hypothetical protein
MTDAENIFNVIPEIEDFISFGKFEIDLENVPTRRGKVTIKMQLLWESENYEITKNSAKECDANDMMTRGAWMKLETLVQSITKIGNVEYTDKDESKNEVLKSRLRMELGQANPRIIQHLYNSYGELVKKRDEWVDEKMIPFQEKLKKKLEKNLKPL